MKKTTQIEVGIEEVGKALGIKDKITGWDVGSDDKIVIFLEDEDYGN
jgi:hypothetical protein